MGIPGIEDAVLVPGLVGFVRFVQTNGQGARDRLSHRRSGADSGFFAAGRSLPEGGEEDGWNSTVYFVGSRRSCLEPRARGPVGSVSVSTSRVIVLMRLALAFQG